MSATERELVALIPTWLTVTRGGGITTGLSREEAFGRARLLRRLLAEGKAPPDSVVLDEELKDVFYALVHLVTEVEPLPDRQLAEEADAIYQFEARVKWDEDDFDERQDLLVRCAEAGWRALGLTLTGVKAKRFSEEVTQTTPLFKPVPLSLKSLRQKIEPSPKQAAEEAATLYGWLSKANTHVGLFDERKYLLGELTLIAAKSTRLLGKLQVAKRWLDRSEANFRDTVDGAGPLTAVAYERLAIEYTAGRFDDILELIPSVNLSFQRLGMLVDEAKGRFLEAKTRQALGDVEGCFRVLQELEQSEVVRQASSLHGQVLTNIGDHYSSIGRYDAAADVYEAALPVIICGGRPIALAELKWVIGDTYRRQGSWSRALKSYRSARDGYGELEAEGFVAGLSLTIAEALLALDRPREAEWEILQALPTIEEQKMVPEGFAAVALLRESVRQQKTDPEALRQLREHLQRQR